MQNSSILSLLRERAGLQPDDLAFRCDSIENAFAQIRAILPPPPD